MAACWSLFVHVHQQSMMRGQLSLAIRSSDKRGVEPVQLSARAPPACHHCLFRYYSPLYSRVH